MSPVAIVLTALAMRVDDQGSTAAAESLILSGSLLLMIALASMLSMAMHSTYLPDDSYKKTKSALGLTNAFGCIVLATGVGVYLANNGAAMRRIDFATPVVAAVFSTFAFFSKLATASIRASAGGTIERILSLASLTAVGSTLFQIAMEFDGCVRFKCNTIVGSSLASIIAGSIAQTLGFALDQLLEIRYCEPAYDPASIKQIKSRSIRIFCETTEFYAIRDFTRSSPVFLYYYSTSSPLLRPLLQYLSLAMMASYLVFVIPYSSFQARLPLAAALMGHLVFSLAGILTPFLAFVWIIRGSSAVLLALSQNTFFSRFLYGGLAVGYATFLFGYLSPETASQGTSLPNVGATIFMASSSLSMALFVIDESWTWIAGRVRLLSGIDPIQVHVGLKLSGSAALSISAFMAGYLFLIATSDAEPMNSPATAAWGTILYILSYTCFSAHRYMAFDGQLVNQREVLILDTKIPLEQPLDPSQRAISMISLGLTVISLAFIIIGAATIGSTGTRILDATTPPILVAAVVLASIATVLSVVFRWKSLKFAAIICGLAALGTIGDTMAIFAQSISASSITGLFGGAIASLAIASLIFTMVPRPLYPTNPGYIVVTLVIQFIAYFTYMISFILLDETTNASPIVEEYLQLSFPSVPAWILIFIEYSRRHSLAADQDAVHLASRMIFAMLSVIIGGRCLWHAILTGPNETLGTGQILKLCGALCWVVICSFYILVSCGAKPSICFELRKPRSSEGNKTPANHEQSPGSSPTPEMTNQDCATGGDLETPDIERTVAVHGQTEQTKQTKQVKQTRQVKQAKRAKQAGSEMPSTRFSTATIESMAKAVRRLQRSAVADPGRRSNSDDPVENRGGLEVQNGTRDSDSDSDSNNDKGNVAEQEREIDRTTNDIVHGKPDLDHSPLSEQSTDRPRSGFRVATLLGDFKALRNDASKAIRRLVASPKRPENTKNMARPSENRTQNTQPSSSLYRIPVSDDSPNLPTATQSILTDDATQIAKPNIDAELPTPLVNGWREGGPSRNDAHLFGQKWIRNSQVLDIEELDLRE
ncbi:uncharacterized protein BJ171DRAFT_566850 [Polychytrium aggregatum]|uniref:uncharacterized protein n=1 Tax=Polychytrium aggregatum TaxID=110093 RepID=UPI0022FDB657|nr:uncharacterized protein BJ171DRAFT_566850 [Polychytrium aggregatum]KAI9206542.1 hypothetical protein BJ171DRAFT_566850 [Polychytrium aggregatum]